MEANQRVQEPRERFEQQSIVLDYDKKYKIYILDSILI